MLPDIGAYHPQIVHFVIALLVVGVAFRLVSLTGRMKWTGPAATVLLVVGTIAAVLAAFSGTQAHEAVESIPGVRQAVEAHQEWGERTRDLFLFVAGFELVALLVRKKVWSRWLLVASAVVGLVGIGFIYETGERGGELVYAYAGGPGVRTGDAQDVDRLLLAGLYQKAMMERRQKHPEQAAALFQELEQRYGSQDPTIRLLAIQSQLDDRHDPEGTLAALRSYPVPANDRFTQYRVGLLKADAFEQLHQTDSARAALQQLLKVLPGNRRIQARLDSLGAGGTSAGDETGR